VNMVPGAKHRVGYSNFLQKHSSLVSDEEKMF
jgi:hypothetical protein